MGLALDQDLLSAIEVSDWDMRRLVSSADRLVVQKQLSEIGVRGRRGEDVLAELVALLDRHPELLRYVWFARARAAHARKYRESQPHVQQRSQQQQPQQQQQQQQQALPGTGPYAQARLVNTLVVDVAANERVLTQSEWLQPERAYEVLISIGHHVEGSLLAFKEAHWPSEALPDTGLWLRAVLSLPGARDPIVQQLYLPVDGDSFTCDCEFGHAHQANCEPRQWARFALIAPAAPTVISAEIVLYYEVTAVHVQELTLPVGQHLGYGLGSRAVARLTTTFNSVDDIGGRAVSLVMSATTSRVVVNGLNFADLPFLISANAADTSALNARNLLYQAHFDVRGDKKFSRYDNDFSKSSSEFENDLRRLAREGAALFLRLFASRGEDVELARRLPRLLRQEARSRSRPPIMQVVDERYDEHSMLWGIIYDLPMGGDPSKYEPCPSLSLFGPRGRGHEVPACCPHEAEHRGKGNVLCPFGFWGLSCMLEQPPDAGSRDLPSIVTRNTGPLGVSLAADSSLDGKLAKRHISQLEQHPGEAFLARLPTASEEELAKALGPDTNDVVYFYTHCGYEQQSGGAADRYLTLGDVMINALNVHYWRMTAWQPPHWAERPPLVVLNGCHTTEATSGTLNSFVTAFCRWAGASGVLGTEITLEQGLAGFIMEDIISGLARGRTVGEALRDTRWNLLRRGNVMGFAYTPYCLSTLAFRYHDAAS
jgi:hypothetical protein